jgi:CHRD domain-containing protein
VGTATELGSIVVPLMPGGVFAPTGCADVARDQLKVILRDPSGFYVNLITDEFPTGALRGQLG